MTTELPLDQVRTLLAVVDEGTFDAAAAALHVTPSAVSQRVKALEQRTGRVLLVRTKPVRPTESGEVVVRFARQLARLERDALAALGLPGEGEVTRVSVAVNADSLATWFLGALRRVPGQERLCFELRREDETRTAELLREGLVMAAVTSSPEAVAGCSVRTLGRMRYLAAAAPDFVEQPAGRGVAGRAGARAGGDVRPERRHPGRVPARARPGRSRSDASHGPHVGGVRGGGRAGAGVGNGARGAGGSAAAVRAAGRAGP